MEHIQGGISEVQCLPIVRLGVDVVILMQIEMRCCSRNESLAMKWVEAGVLSSRWRLEPPAHTEVNPVLKLLRYDVLRGHGVCQWETSSTYGLQKRTQADSNESVTREAASSAPPPSDYASSARPPAIPLPPEPLPLAANEDNTEGGREATERPSSPSKRPRLGDPAEGIKSRAAPAADSTVSDGGSDGGLLRRHAVTLLHTDVDICATQLKAMGTTPKSAAVQTLCSLLDTLFETCLAPSSTFHSALCQFVQYNKASRSEYVAAGTGLSGVVLLVQCMRSLGLHGSSVAASDEVFLAIVDAYTNPEERSMRYLPHFLHVVVMPRLRSLSSPASRICMRAMELLAARCVKDFITCALCGALAPPLVTAPPPSEADSLTSHTAVAEVPLRDCSYQLESVQRMTRQVSALVLNACVRYMPFLWFHLSRLCDCGPVHRVFSRISTWTCCSACCLRIDPCRVPVFTTWRRLLFRTRRAHCC